MMHRHVAREHAAKLNEATRSGNLSAAYVCIRSLPDADAAAVMLAAGHAITTYRAKSFRAEIQATIAAACKSRSDGSAHTAQRKLAAG